MPRHSPFYLSLAVGAVALLLGMWLAPDFAVSLGSNGLFVTYLLLTYFKLPHLTADYLRKHAQEEDTPVGGIFLVAFIVVAASIVSLFLALSGGQQPDPWQVAASVVSVLLGWFTVQSLGALHYAYEYYQAPDTGEDGAVEGGLEFQGDRDPDEHPHDDCTSSGPRRRVLCDLLQLGCHLRDARFVERQRLARA